MDPNSAPKINFSKALDALTEGKMIARLAFGVVKDKETATGPNRWLQKFTAGSEAIVIQVQPGAVSNYGPSNADLMAEDWYLVE